jgi:nucleotide-binding universal stress UspA family protein
MLPPKRIMSPIDFSHPSADAVEEATDLAAHFKAEMLLVYVVPAIPKLPSTVSMFKEGEYEQALHRDAQQHLDEMAKKISQKGIKVRTLVGTANDVGMELVRLAEHENVDLIVIATHGMTGWRRLAFGSVTEKVVRTAECPVLVMRAKPEEVAAAS